MLGLCTRSRSLIQRNGRSVIRLYSAKVKTKETKKDRDQREEKHDVVNTRNTILGGIFAVAGALLGSYLYHTDPLEKQRVIDEAELHLTVANVFESQDKQALKPLNNVFRNDNIVDMMTSKVTEIIDGVSNDMILFTGDRGVGKTTSMKICLYEISQIKPTSILYFDMEDGGLYGFASKILPRSLLKTATEENKESLHRKIYNAIHKYSVYRKKQNIPGNAVIVIDHCNSSLSREILELREIGKKLCDDDDKVRLVFVTGEGSVGELLDDARRIHVSQVSESSKEVAIKYLNSVHCPNPNRVEAYVGGVIQYLHEVRRQLVINPKLSCDELLSNLDNYLSVQYRDINQLMVRSRSMRTVCKKMLTGCDDNIDYSEFYSILKTEFSNKKINKLLNTEGLFMSSPDGLKIGFYSRAKKSYIERLLKRINGDDEQK
ncbi:hypothetical protein AKO1_013089 [Acrasis kona]|uniref:AAA+ ATPase domain-containing protein n=1 Tax=Acrasis kona TaxID=1008807 RepID=A0AAW2YYC1_9EUKA